MCDIYGGYAGIKEKLMEKLRHPYFINYIEEPFIDEEKIALLYGALKVQIYIKNKLIIM